MTTSVSNGSICADLVHTYKRQVPVVLVNGLAEQSESWFANRTALSRHFDLKVPEILVYDGDALHQRIESGGEITRRIPGGSPLPVPRRVRSALALLPGGVEPGLPGRA